MKTSVLEKREAGLWPSLIIAIACLTFSDGCLADGRSDDLSWLEDEPSLLKEQQHLVFEPKLVWQLLKEWQKPSMQEAMKEHWNNPKLSEYLSKVDLHAEPLSTQVQAVMDGLPLVPPEVRDVMPLTGVLYSLLYEDYAPWLLKHRSSPRIQDEFRKMLGEKYPLLPPETRSLLQDNIRIAAFSLSNGKFVADNPVETRPNDRYSEREVLGALEPEEQLALADRVHLLGKPYALARSMHTAAPETKAAIATFLLEALRDHEEVVFFEEDRKSHEEAKLRGYFTDSRPTPEVIELLGIAQDLMRNIEATDHYADTERGGMVSTKEPGVFLLEEFERDYPTQMQKLRPVPNYAVLRHSRNYVFPGSRSTFRIFSESSFGGALLVEESAVSKVHQLGPNLEIAGHPASVSVVSYTGDVWSTVITAYDGDKAYKIEVSARLEGEDRDRFVGFARDLIE